MPSFFLKGEVWGPWFLSALAPVIVFYWPWGRRMLSGMLAERVEARLEREENT